MTPDILKAICRFQGEAQTFWDAMTKTFLDHSTVDGSITAHDWEKANASLIGRWKGGQITATRPQPPAKPQAKLPAKPIAKLQAAVGLNADQLPAAGEREEKSREEEIGEERKRVNGNGTHTHDSISSIQEFKALLATMYKRRNQLIWPQSEEMLLAQIVRRDDWKDELAELQEYRDKDGKFFPRSIASLLEGWDKTLDQARNQFREKSIFD